ncbi:tyrosine-type recombinase/integrase [Enterococcus sp. AZ102]|uniref:tyrosine-type recombinase/integrase n=1 Tax=Enterococcus sp. AZ102 TaxID=2774865 RepID=UPI003F27BFCB
MYALKELLIEFDFYNQSKNFAEKTIYKRFKHVSDFISYTKKKNLEEITATDIRRYLIDQKEKDLSRSYINSILRSIRSFFAFCEHEEYLLPSKNPVSKVSWLREKQTIIETFTDAEVKRMLHYRHKKKFFESRNRLIVALFIETAIRAQSLINLKDEDFKKDFIQIKVAKNYKEYIVPNTPFIMRLYLKYIRERNKYFSDDEDDYLILNSNGGQLTTSGLERIITSIAKQAKVRSEIRSSPHTFRHTAAQMMLKNGADIYEVSKLLGHADIRITETYLRSMKTSDIVKRQIKNSNLSNLK